MTDPARVMSKDDAFAELKRLEADGVILLEGQGNTPRHVSLDGWDPVAQAKQDGNVAGVIVRYSPTGKKTAAGTEVTASGGAAPDQLDARNALALVRLCQWLAQTYGATELYHLGISGGGTDRQGNPRIDCHGQGRAVDFVGALVAAYDGGTAPVTVWDDWGSITTQVTPGGHWPAGTGNAVSYRLDDPNADEWSRDFFRELYNFIAGEWQDSSTAPDEAETRSAIGEPSFIMHPDHPSDPPFPHGRSAHREHIHMQIGVTGTA
jgi:hypothetical protein